MTVMVREAHCHSETCLDVEGPSNHIANVNPIGYSDDLWRVDCDFCFTCVRAGLSKKEALEEAKKHVLMSRENYFASLEF